jgi:hypothetical protein
MIGDMKARGHQLSRGTLEGILTGCNEHAKRHWMHSKRFLFDMVTTADARLSDKNTDSPASDAEPTTSARKRKYYKSPSNKLVASVLQSLADGFSQNRSQRSFRDVIVSARDVDDAATVSTRSANKTDAHPAIDVIRTWNKYQLLLNCRDNHAYTYEEMAAQFQEIIESNHNVEEIVDINFIDGELLKPIGMAAVRAGRMDMVFDLLRASTANWRPKHTRQAQPEHTKVQSEASGAHEVVAPDDEKSTTCEKVVQLSKATDQLWARPANLAIGLSMLLIHGQHGKVLYVPVSHTCVDICGAYRRSTVTMEASCP